MAKANPDKQFMADVASLAAYEPRNQAIRWILDGRIESYLDWELSDGYVAASGQPAPGATERDRRKALFRSMRLDLMLNGPRMRGLRREPDAFKAARMAIKHFMESPLEIALRYGSDEAFEKCLQAWSSPNRRFADVDDYSESEGWTGRLARAGETSESLHAAVELFRLQNWDLLRLAFMLGKPERADAMFRHGMCPSTEMQWHAFRDRLFRWSEIDSGLIAFLADVESVDVKPILEWSWKKVMLIEELDKEFDKPRDAQGFDADASDRRILDLVRMGAPVGYMELAKATQWGRLNLLRELFTAGADPNIKYKNGDPVLARIVGPALTLDALQIWLDAGARPMLGPDEDRPFGAEYYPSVLYQFTSADEIEFVQACCDKAQGPVSLTYVKEGQTYAPLLAVAVRKMNLDVAAWLVKAKGCRLSHLDPETGNACRANADRDFVDEMAAEVKRLRTAS